MGAGLADRLPISWQIAISLVTRVLWPVSQSNARGRSSRSDLERLRVIAMTIRVVMSFRESREVPGSGDCPRIDR